MSDLSKPTYAELQATVTALTKRVRDLEEARLGELRFELTDTFPAFSELIHQLTRLHTACAVLGSPSYDSRPSSKLVGTTWETTPQDAGASTRGDRENADDANTTMRNLAARIADALSPKGKLHPDEHPHLPAPICWNPSCPAVGHRQSYQRSIDNGGPGTCDSCGDEYTAHRPFDDKTQPADKRCLVRGCPKRNKVNQCIHSWQKMGVGR